MRKRHQVLIYIFVIVLVLSLLFVGFAFPNNNPDKLYGRNIEKLIIDQNIYNENNDGAFARRVSLQGLLFLLYRTFL
mgnify:CR=1 FL=1